MKTIELYQQKDPQYAAVCTFAQRVYQQQLSFCITHFPEYFFALRDGVQIVGCIGLNSELSSPLFLNDKRVRAVMQELPPSTRFCEQSIFALDHYSLGVPVLIAAITEYAQALGIDKLVYAGIDVSRRTIAHLGFPVIECGSVDLCVLPQEERKKYELWNTTQHPVTCMLDTTNAPAIAYATLKRHAHRIQKSEKLSASLLSKYVQFHPKAA